MGSAQRTAAVLVAVGVTILAGCFQTTPYQPDGLGGGYSSSQVDASTMRVSFRSNARTPQRTVELYMLYRCAQVTRDAGYGYFVLLNPSTGAADTAAGIGTMALASNDSIATRKVYFPDSTLSFDQDGAHTTIKMFRGKMPAGVPAAYSAAEVITDLTPAIRGEVPVAEQSAPEQSAAAARIYRGAVKDYLKEEP